MKKKELTTHSTTAKDKKKHLLIALTSPGVTQKHAGTAQKRVILVLHMATNIMYFGKTSALTGILRKTRGTTSQVLHYKSSTDKIIKGNQMILHSKMHIG